MNEKYYSASEFYRKMTDDLVFDKRDGVILLCAILIASIGLNMNSIPVVIGAMLISPLMTPIIGMGIGLGLYSKTLFRKSLKLLSIQIAISLAVSIVYFLISPISYASEQLIARTSPTIWDIVIAFVGGIAGFIGNQRREGGNIIPGVAIATALMPPLCTVGYSIAQGEWSYFLGASYLFLINTVFIMLATIVGMHATSFTKKMKELRENNKKQQVWFVVLLVMFSIPSILSAGTMISNSYQRLAINNMIAEEFSNVTLIKKDFDKKTKDLNIVVYGENIPDSELKNKKDRMNNYGLEEVNLTVQQISDTSNKDLLKALKEKNKKEAEGVEDLVVSEKKSTEKKLQ